MNTELFITFCFLSVHEIVSTKFLTEIRTSVYEEVCIRQYNTMHCEKLKPRTYNRCCQGIFYASLYTFPKLADSFHFDGDTTQSSEAIWSGWVLK